MFRLMTFRAVLSISILCVLVTSAAATVNVTILTPIGGGYANGATVNGNGTFSWGNNDNSVDVILLYTLSGSANPQFGRTWSTMWANIPQKTTNQAPPNGPGGGNGQWNTQTTNGQTLTAPKTGGMPFYFTAVPVNAAAGPFTVNGTLYYKSKTLTIQ